MPRSEVKIKLPREFLGENVMDRCFRLTRPFPLHLRKYRLNTISNSRVTLATVTGKRRKREHIAGYEKSIELLIQISLPDLATVKTNRAMSWESIYTESK